MGADFKVNKTGICFGRMRAPRFWRWAVWGNVSRNDERAGRRGSRLWGRARCGGAVADMEFVQFTPTAMAYPPQLRGRNSGGMALSFPETRMRNSLNERVHDPLCAR